MGKQGSGGDRKGPAEGEYSNHRVAKPLSDEFNQYGLRVEYISSLSKGDLRADSTGNPEVLKSLFSKELIR